MKQLFLTLLIIVSAMPMYSQEDNRRTAEEAYDYGTDMQLDQNGAPSLESQIYLGTVSLSDFKKKGDSNIEFITIENTNFYPLHNLKVHLEYFVKNKKIGANDVTIGYMLPNSQKDSFVKSFDQANKYEFHTEKKSKYKDFSVRYSLSYDEKDIIENEELSDYSTQLISIHNLGSINDIFTNNESITRVNRDENYVYDIVEEMPLFNGDLMQWLSENIHYPAEAAENSVEKRVLVQFVVDKKGYIKSATVINSNMLDDKTKEEIAREVSDWFSGKQFKESEVTEAITEVTKEYLKYTQLLDNEGLRVVNSMPRWTPGKQNGEYVNCKFTLPISFRLQ